MYVEDKVSHQGPIPLQVSPSMTVGQLRAKVAREFQLPEHVQRWILGKQLANDLERTLLDHNVTESGCPLFLYLVAPGENEYSTVQMICHKYKNKTLLTYLPLFLAEQDADAEGEDGGSVSGHSAGSASSARRDAPEVTNGDVRRLPPPPTVGRDPDRRGGWYYNYEEDRYSFCEDSDSELSNDEEEPPNK